jgi:hypothetical protein
MGTDNILLLTNLLTTLLGKATEYAALIARARAESRDVTGAELQALLASDDQARAELEAAIERSNPEG